MSLRLANGSRRDALADASARCADTRVVVVTDAVLDAMSPFNRRQASSAIARRPAASLDRVLAKRPELVLYARMMFRTPATSGPSCAPQRAAARRVSSAASARRIPSAGKLCAARWGAPSGCRSQSDNRCSKRSPQLARGACASSPRRHAAARRCRSATCTCLLPSCSAAKEPDCRMSSSPPRMHGLRFRCRPPVESLERRDRRGARDLRGGETTSDPRRPCRCLTTSHNPQPSREGHRRRSPSGCVRARSTSSSARRRSSAPARPLAPRHRAGPPAVDHPLGPAGHRQDDAGATHRQRHARSLHLVQRGALRHQGDPRGHVGSGGGAGGGSAGAPSSSSTRSIASTRRSRTRFCRASRPATSCSSAPRPRILRSK